MFFTVSLLAQNLILIAQEEDPIFGLDTLNSSDVKSGELANCFDTYKFQSILLNVGVDKSTYKPYETVEIKGDIVNTNSYPVTNLALRARILKKHPDPINMRAEYITLDEQIVLSDITLNSNQTYQFDQFYFVPGNYNGGEYIIQYYVYNQDRFNLSGLSFTEDIIANQTSFNVENNSDKQVYLDTTNILVNDKEHNTRGFITRHDKNEDITIKLPLINSTEEARDMNISYKLYKWDAILEGNLIEEQIQKVNIRSNSKLNLEYIVNNNEYPVYYVVIEALPVGENENSINKEKTMAYIRYSLDGNNMPRVNWVGVDKNPFELGELTLLTCVHNTNYITDEGPVKLKSIAKNEKGIEMGKIEYEGKMVSSISAISNKINTYIRFNILTIETNLYNASNELVDNIITEYKCDEISPELCLDNSNTSNNNLLNRMHIFTLSIIILSIIGGVRFYTRYKKLNN
jgi:hypothetical protein